MIRALAAAALALIVLFTPQIHRALYSSAATRVASTDAPTIVISKTEMLLYIDPATGCHYLSRNTSGSSLSPRMTSEGKQVCDGAKPKPAGGVL